MQLIDLKTLSKRTSLSIPTCRKLIKKGLPHYRIERKILVDENECFDWMQRFKQSLKGKSASIDHLLDQTLNTHNSGSA